MRAARVLIASALLVLWVGGCSKKSDPPTAPPPDNPIPPTLQFVPNFQAASQAISFTPPGEDLGLEVVTVYFQHSGFGGIQVSTDFSPSLVPKGGIKTVQIMTPWTWQDSDFYTVGVRTRRPGQTLTFGLCCRGCDHNGGTLQLGPCQ